jgi:RNA polymerase sigma factor (sigma-70 family)
MVDTSPDSQLVSAYAVKGSETAFDALVRRHIDLVFATAMRQTGNAALAEEITQNVFISLARKAPRLGGVQTLAGWLHRATVLETKARVRSELRRREREQTAFELTALANEGASPLAALAPLLDEALLNLGESDRLALVLRFLEERSLREVGNALGVAEDAARKRVARALERLAEFFRKRGFAVATGTAPSVFAGALHAAPPALAPLCLKSLPTAAASGGLVKTILFHIMKLTKTQTAAACLLLVAGPLAWQHLSQSALARQLSSLDEQASQTGARADALEAEAARVRGLTAQMSADSAAATLQLQKLQAQLNGAAAAPQYHWDDHSPYVRLPKSFINGFGAVGTRRGQLTPQITELLQMTGDEASQTQNAVKQFISRYDALEARNLQQVSPQADDLSGHPAEQTRVFEVPYMGAGQMEPLRQDFFGEVVSILGGDRAGIFTNALSGWMPVTEDYNGISGMQAVFNSSFRARIYQPSAGATQFQLNVSTANHSSMSCAFAPDDVPELFQPYMQDWLAAMQNPAP